MVDLQTFVADTLTQILQGIRTAQGRQDGGDVAAEGYVTAGGGNVVNSYESGYFTVVDFDILVVAETKDGGNTVKVASAEISDTSTKTAQNASRVKFSVPVRLPQGGKDRGPNYYANETSHEYEAPY